MAQEVLSGTFNKNSNISYIHRFLHIGLDPPSHAVNKSLTIDAALNVDIIHTSLLGNSKPMGHADFYVNGGKWQPGCNPTNGSICLVRIVSINRLSFYCSCLQPPQKHSAIL